MSKQKNQEDLNMSNNGKKDLIPEEMRKEFESIADANAQWLQSTCISACDTLYGPEPSEAVRFEVKAAIEQAYDQDIINEIFTVYDAAQSSPDAMWAVKVILYLLGLSDADPIKG